VGNSYKFRVIEIRDERDVVVSRASLLEEEAKAARERTLAELQVGSVVQGVVTRLADFGAFVDLGGIEGLIHISEIGHRHLDHPSEELSEGQTVEVEVVKMEEDRDRLKIGLSRKNLIKDPWEAALEEIMPGDEFNGTVVRLESFGAFVEVRPGVEGLVHVSEMSWTKRVTHPGDVVSVGDTVLVKVQNVDIQRRRISLTMKAAEGDPWKDVENNVSVGDEVTGTVEKVEDFGAFIRLEKLGVTALLPKSEMELSRSETVFSKAIKGTEMTARVISVEPERRRMALSLKSAAELDDAIAEKTAPKTYEEASGGGFGTLGDLLKDKLKK
jgi:small subunit ribosomal protein S1